MNQLTACLKAYYPVALACFDGLTRMRRSPSCRPSPRSSAHAPPPARRWGRHCASALSPCGRESRGLAPPAAPAATGGIRGGGAGEGAPDTRLGRAAARRGAQVAAYDQEIARLFLQHPDHAIFASLPGAGKRLAPRLLAEWGEDRGHYLDASRVQALAGTAPVVFQSGDYRVVRRRLACVNPFREALYHFARERVLLEAWASAYYRRTRRGGQDSGHDVAGVGEPLGADPLRHVEPPRAL